MYDNDILLWEEKREKGKVELVGRVGSYRIKPQYHITG